MDIEKLAAALAEALKGLLPQKTAVIEKSVNSAERKALFVVLEPEKVDLHGDIYSAVEVEKAMHNFNDHCKKANLGHRVETQDAHISQSYTTPVDMVIEGVEVKKGTWLQEWHFPEGNEVSENIWQAVLNGQINGVSIGARAVEEIL